MTKLYDEWKPLSILIFQGIFILFIYHFCISLQKWSDFHDFHSKTPELSNPFTERRDYQEDYKEDDAADELEQLLKEEERSEEKVEGLCSCCKNNIKIVVT